MIMKKILIIILLSFISLPIAFAQESCQIAIPRYGSVVCRSQNIYEPVLTSFVASSDKSTLTYACLSNCELKSNDVKIQCDWSIGGWKAEVNGIEKYSTGMFGEKANEIKWSRGDTFLITAKCRGADFWTTHPVKDASSVTISQLKIMLEEAWAGSLEYVPIPNTEGCALNKVVDRYRGDIDVQSYLDPQTGSPKSKLSSTYTSVNQMPTNWKVSESYIFVKDWQTGIAGISLTYDKQNNAYWCGGLSGSRKIYNVNKVTSVTGSCYAIPDSIYKPNIECCFPADCSWKGMKYTCNPDTWSCEETRWCDSDLDCQQVFGEGICQNKQITKWACNTNKKWGTHLGTCEKIIRTVQQCSSDCTNSEYYNEEEGRCKSRVTILDCPLGKCCKSGGNYKEKSCSSGLLCCSTADPILGECKQSCEPTTTTISTSSKASSGSSGVGLGTGMATSAPTDFIWIPIIIVIAGLGGAGYFFWQWYNKKPKKTEKIEKEKKREVGKSKKKFCTKCGKELKLGAKFCTSCGKKS